MILWILWIPLVASYRLLKLKLKETEDLFVTNSKGTLKLLPLSIPNQSVVVHSRRLFFVQQGLLYKMYLNPGSLEIHLKNDRREIGFLKSGSPRKKRVNPFSFASRKPKREEAMSPKEFSRSKERIKLKETKVEDRGDNKVEDRGGYKVEDRGDNKVEDRGGYKVEDRGDRYTTKVEDRVDRYTTKVEDIPTKVEDTTKIEYTTKDEDSSAKQIEILKTILATLDRNKSNTNTTSNTTTPTNTNTLPPTTTPLHTPPWHTSDKDFVESDSKIDEDTLKYQQVDVFVSSLDRTYFKLRTSTNNCVTFHHNSFIFTPCINIDNQIFKLVKEEEIKKIVEENNEDFEEESSSSTRKDSSSKRKDSSGKRNEEDYAHKNNKRYIENYAHKEENKSSGLLSYDKQMREKFKDCKNLKVFCNRKSKDYNEEACREVIEKCEDVKPKEDAVEKKNTVEDNPPPQNYSPFLKPTLQSPPTSNIIRSILKNEAVKKDFNPDDIIEKLQNSINTNDFSDLM
ncbi:hypothetical protein NGRA_2615 [Nosema granulosis]|uniref:Uncharacterized protein n=1 Tax=Nosema granulosis TaxID=83296 RepID=A0A9P6GXR2_9MICR|nr:hypothetical protein NGRA_2615 [Nosema granulosis]